MTCRHTLAIREVVPSARGCEECLKIGSAWVHLRLCRTCGHVGCCDDSPHRHATAHFQRAGTQSSRDMTRPRAGVGAISTSRGRSARPDTATGPDPKIFLTYAAPGCENAIRSRSRHHKRRFHHQQGCLASLRSQNGGSLARFFCTSLIAAPTWARVFR
jgi:hypothetical protein